MINEMSVVSFDKMTKDKMPGASSRQNAWRVISTWRVIVWLVIGRVIRLAGNLEPITALISIPRSGTTEVESPARHGDRQNDSEIAASQQAALEARQKSNLRPWFDLEKAPSMMSLVIV